jgi:hypothetical protein
VEKASGIPTGVTVVLVVAWSLSVIILLLALRTCPHRWIKVSLGIAAAWMFVVSALMTYVAAAAM